VEIDERYLRPTDVAHLEAEPIQARERLGWDPKIGFSELVRIMVDADLEAIGVTAPGEGRAVVESKLIGWHSWNKSDADAPVGASTAMV